MLLTEWNQDDALVVAREEALEDGIGIGRKKEREELFVLWEKGFSLAEAKKILRG
jgi:hypothetical protein